MQLTNLRREFVLGDVLHRTLHLDAYSQYKLLRKIEPGLTALGAVDEALVLGGGALALDVLEARISSESSEHISTLYEACAAACERYSEEADAWQSATKALPLLDMQALVRVVVDVNFGAYFSMHRAKFQRTSGIGKASGAVPVGSRPKEIGLFPGDDWFWRPVVDAHMFSYMEMVDGRARLEHVAHANELLDVKYENEARVHAAIEAGNK